MNIQETQFGSRLFLLGNNAEATSLNQFIAISTPAHISKYDLGQNSLAGNI